MDYVENAHEVELIDLGSVTEETKGVALEPRIDAFGNFGGGGLTDD